MFKVIEGNDRGLSDVDGFVNFINQLPPELDDLFVRKADIFVTRAPGRLDVMGGIADYSGSLMLELPIREATFAAIQKRDDQKIRIVSFAPGSAEYLDFEMSLRELSLFEGSRFYNEGKEFFVRNPLNHWASYVAGTFFVLHHELGTEFRNGSRILISSSVPLGKGVSSSAALEIAMMRAVCQAYRIQVDARQTALLCQKVENHIAGAPCGVMDQISVNCGIENALLSILCQPAEIQGAIDIPDEIEFWGIDSGVRHSVAGASYSSVRAGAFMGYRILADAAGFNSQPVDEGHVKIDDDRWNGYLANVSPVEYEQDFATSIRLRMRGKEFLDRFSGITDPVSAIDPSLDYQIKAPTEHAIYESSRVRRFASLLNSSISTESLKELGKLMFRSHESYSACGLTEPRTDRIVEIVRNDLSGDLFGARITGGGSGGTVVVLCRRNSGKIIDGLVRKFEDETGHKAYLFHGSSPGAVNFGHIRLSSQAEIISELP